MWQYFGSSQEHIRPSPGRNKKRAHALTGVTDLSEKSNSAANQNDREEFLASGKLRLPSGGNVARSGLTVDPQNLYQIKAY